MTETGSDYLLSALSEEGVTALFGLVGEGNSHLVDRLHEATVEYRYARHEQVAVGMADGYARTTGRVGACTLTHGPGLTNGLTALAAADRDNVPLVIIVGDNDRGSHETSLQYLDHIGMTEDITVYGTRVETPATLPEDLRRAFDKARTRSGPVIVEVPGDIQEAPAPDRPYRPKRHDTGRVRPDPERVTAVADLLDRAERPAILAGGGAAAADAGAELEALAERLGAPIATTFYARGVLPESHPLVTGIAGTFMTPASADLVLEADALLAVGAQLSGKTTRYGDLFGDADVAQIDISRDAIGRHRDVDVGVVGDGRATVGALAAEVTPAPDRTQTVRDRIAAADRPEELPFESASDRVDPRALTVAVSEAAPGDTIVTVDSGNNTGFPALFHRVDGDERMLVNGNFGTMGYALPAALGAKVAAPDNPVVCYTGDGGLLQVLQDIETAVRYELGIVFVVYNDASYGIIRHRQNLDYDRETASKYDSPDFATVARGLGAGAVTVRNLEDDFTPIETHLADDPDYPLVVDARTIPEVSRPGFPPY